MLLDGTSSIIQPAIRLMEANRRLSLSTWFLLVWSAPEAVESLALLRRWPLAMPNAVFGLPGHAAVAPIQGRGYA